MDMSSHSSTAGKAATCKISMLWNWYTIDSCFIARSWHVRTRGQFAGSCIGVFLLVVALEFVRRSQREYDRYVVRQAQARLASTTAASPSTATAPAEGSSSCGSGDGSGLVLKKGVITPLNLRPTLVQQAVRAGFYTVQFGVAYIVMLLAMYYNGYIIISILLGAFFGHFVFGYDNITIGGKQETGTSCC